MAEPGTGPGPVGGSVGITGLGARPGSVCSTQDGMAGFVPPPGPVGGSAGIAGFGPRPGPVGGSAGIAGLGGRLGRFGWFHWDVAGLGPGAPGWGAPRSGAGQPVPGEVGSRSWLGSPGAGRRAPGIPGQDA